MPLSAEQQKRAKQALQAYTKKVRNIVTEHKQKIYGIVENFDKQKSDSLRERIRKG